MMPGVPASVIPSSHTLRARLFGGWVIALVIGFGASVLGVVLAWWPLLVAPAPFNKGGPAENSLDAVLLHAVILAVGIGGARGAQVGISQNIRAFYGRCIRIGAKAGAVLGVVMPVLLAVLRADPNAPTYSVSMLIVGAPVGATIGAFTGAIVGTSHNIWPTDRGRRQYPHDVLVGIGVWLLLVSLLAGLGTWLTQYPFIMVPILVGVVGVGCIAGAAARRLRTRS